MITEPLKIAIKSLMANKVRSFLSVLGIVIGISAVITVISAGQGVKVFVLDQVETFGTDLIEIEIKVPSKSKTSLENVAGLLTGTEITTLTLDDQTAIDKLPNIKNSYAGVMGQQVISYAGQNSQIILWGTSASFVDIDKTKVEEGRFFTDEEDKTLVNVVVLGKKVREDIFGQNDYLGKSIRIGKQKYKVIGMMEGRGASFGIDMDNMIFVPIRNLQKKIMGISHVSFIMTQVYDNTIEEKTAEDITLLLRQRHDIQDPLKDDFHATPLTEALEILDSVFLALLILLFIVGGISLIVGGVGIMNIMYVSVTERTYEIGLRKAVGATNRKILLQFLWESVIITFLGAIFGIIFGALLSIAITLAAGIFGITWKLVILPSSLLLACGVSAAIGIIFGVFPARTAARLDPVTALRK